MAAPGGGWHLAKREDGSCVYLGAGGCGLFNDPRRPLACRTWDCRWHRLLAVDADDPAIQAASRRIGRFRTSDKEDRTMRAALREAAHDGGPPRDLHQALRRAGRWRAYRR